MDNTDFKNLNITLVGLGLIGGSIAKSIRKNVRVKNLWAVDIDEKTLKYAEKEKVIDKGFTEGKFPLENSDIIILSTYPKATLDFIINNSIHFKPEAIVTDTSGIKTSIIREIKNLLPEDVIFIGGHPMAGKELSGYENSDDKILKNCEYIITPENNTNKRALKILTKLIKSMGFKEITTMTPENHDTKIAFTSQLPHIIACALMNNKKLDDSTSGIGGSFKDMTRVAKINSNLWCELINDNKLNILKELEVFRDDINKIYDIIESEDQNQLKEIFKKSTLRRKDMENEKINC
jgi:prephenate dehydrogenase